MWVRVSEWMIVDDEPPLPDVGTVLSGVGIRISGTLALADPASPDGVAQVAHAATHEPDLAEYRLIGIAEPARAIQVGGHVRPPDEPLAEFVVTAAGIPFQVQFRGRPDEIGAGSRVAVTGRLALVGDYEWDDFDLTDTRTDWLVDQVHHLRSGDVMLDLVHRPQR